MKKFLVFIFTTSILFFSQCKKYPEGPSFSLRTKTERISNTWKLNQLIVNNVDSTAQYSNILKDYTVIIDQSNPTHVFFSVYDNRFYEAIRKTVKTNSRIINLAIKLGRMFYLR